MQSSFSTPDSFCGELSNLGIISVEGEEAVSYLQGKVTNDMESLTEDQSQLGCHCDFKGKTWNIFHALKTTNGVDLLCHRESIPASLAELKKYGVFSKVEFSDSSNQWHYFGLSGAQSEQAIEAHFGVIPDKHLQVVSTQQGKVIRFDTPHTRYLVLAHDKLAQQLTKELTTSEMAEKYWEAADILSGLANIQAATSEQFVPQMMNLQALQAISFDKGCYMGQEVVARTKYLGKNKRAAFILKSENTTSVLAGDILEAKMGDNWRRSGTVLRSASLEHGTCVLAILPNDTTAEQIFRAKDTPEQLFTLQPLPYNLD
ncbi:tRNA-modifying protein YgfZ [Aliiglaciecola lipolytica]|uniref:tRNA-modifying protein YgfZ n=1 Tax=Aliiglaciecola lipolytica TaxID=477689 RepID=UPI001C0A533D|nr:tRNA-modifying protein YgfZ [Aliiglaciecola lipolytica]MBU2877850.1 tRNA-modifying protein YgfZ [Aliiglaciecola lipolytica]